MSSRPTLLLLWIALLVCIGTANGSSSYLRSSTPLESKVVEFVEDNNEFTSRQLIDSGFEDDYNGDDYNLNSDASLLNRMIAFLLPVVNAAFQAVAPDPLDLPLKGDFSLGEMDLYFCTGRLDMSYNFGNIVGLKNLTVNSLKVQTGTERVTPGCLETLFSAVFDIEVASVDLFSVDDIRANFLADLCGFEIDQRVAGGINTFAPVLKGAVNISGALLGTMAMISFADIESALKVGYDKMEAYVDGVPDEFNKFLANVTAEMSILMKDELTDYVEPTIHPLIQKSLQQQMQLNYTQAMSLQGNFIRNDAQRKFRNFVSGTRSFLGFGGDDNA